MKLWQKISLVCIAVLLIVVALTSWLLLVTTRNDILLLTVDSAKAAQQNLATTFVKMMESNPTEGMDDERERETILYCFSTLADESSVLLSGEETMYSFASVHPEELLPLSTADQRVFLDEVGKRNLLIVGSLVSAPYQIAPFAVYVVRDISGVYQSYRQMGARFAIIAGLGILLGTALIVVLVRAESRPLKILGLSARRIADGEYGERANLHSRDEVGQLADDFNRMADAVQRQVDALQEKTARQELFISGLTHEFKTPMTSMMLHSETLLSMDLPKEQRDRSLMHIRTQCAWLERLTQKLMKLVTLGEDAYLAESDVHALLARVDESTRENLRKRGTPLTIDCRVGTLPMDADLMQSLLVNLVENASKASESGQEILLRAEGRTLSVTDHGRGIPPDAVARVTEPFFMVDKSRSKAQGGSGLGLALVQRIADAHHAALTIESELGKGTTISVTFPAEERE